MKNLNKGFDYIGVSIIYFCHDGKGNFIMMKRGKNARDEHGRWDIGGGGIELHDSVENTIKKELKEEYCADIINYEFLGFREVHRKYQGKPTHWIALDYKVMVDPKKVKIGEPHKFDDLKWFTLYNLPKNIHSQLAYFLQKYKDKL